ncbi:CRISPR-associated protein Csx19 [Siminovitchia sp. FSL W7-1587]|uniref:type III-D CRISPR-associated protein Csx19 n=1 Tax=Siminovitchia sp. FSL W7-1587 TaxID=2954699 RepID=UPI0030CDC41C
MSPRNEKVLMNLTVTERRSKIEVGSVPSSKLLDLIKVKSIPNGCVYAALDDAICLGVYENDQVIIGKGQERVTEVLQTADYLQELRIFNDQQEFKATRIGQEFRWRIRQDDVEDGERMTCLDEPHKLWGKAKKLDGAKGWSLLEEERGPRLYIPQPIQPNGEKGIWFRKYITFYEWSLEPPQPFHYRFSDERLVAFVDWPVEGEE